MKEITIKMDYETLDALFFEMLKEEYSSVAEMLTDGDIHENDEPHMIEIVQALGTLVKYCSDPEEYEKWEKENKQFQQWLKNNQPE